MAVSIFFFFREQQYFNLCWTQKEIYSWEFLHDVLEKNKASKFKVQKRASKSSGIEKHNELVKLNIEVNV